MREVASGLEFPEGPIAMRDGSVLLVEIKRGTLSRVTPDGRVTVVAETGGGPNGAAIGPDGAVYVCNNGGFEWHEVAGLTVPGDQPSSYTGGSIQRVDLATGRVETLYTACSGRPLRGPNDLVFDRRGGFWFTDHGKVRARERDRGGLYYARPDGSAIREVVFPLDSPNGVGLSPDGTRIYVAETFTGRVWQWEVVAPGEVAAGMPLAPGGATLLAGLPGVQLLGSPAGGGQGEVVARGEGAAGMPLAPGEATLLAGLPGFQLLDSLAVDADGNVCVATLVNGGVTVLSDRKSTRVNASH